MILQYIVFDKTGIEILEAGVIEGEVSEIIANYKSSSEMADLGLVLTDIKSGAVLYDSKKEN